MWKWLRALGRTTTLRWPVRYRKAPSDLIDEAASKTSDPGTTLTPSDISAAATHLRTSVPPLTYTTVWTGGAGGAGGAGFTFVYSSPPPTPINVPEEMRVGEITAYRQWKINWLNTGTALVPRLHSLSHQTIWQPGQDMVAECWDGDNVHPVPSWECNCGIYALKDEDTSVDLMLDNTIFGTVLLWGTVLEGTSGYRASHARILSLDAGERGGEQALEQLRDIYTPGWRLGAKK